MKRLKPFLLALCGALLLTGCEFSITSLPLPGGADVGDDPMTIHVKFPDVLDLVPQSTVKINDVTVGKVTDVTLEGYQADVELLLRKDVDLPDNALAEIRQTSLLGEKFVSLRAPDSPSGGRLGNGDVIGIERTNRNPEVEEVLGALSLLLNGGGVAQLKTISSELNNALEGREGNARSVLTQIESFMGQLDANKADIVRAIDSLNRLAISANQQKDSINSALENLPEALTSLDSQRQHLLKMLRSLDRLGNVGTQIIQASKVATIDALRFLDPVLTNLAKSGDDFANSFHVFLTYPFVDEAVGRNPTVARNLHMGDFTNLSVQLDVDLGSNLPGLPGASNLPPPLQPAVILPNVLTCLTGANPGSPACLSVVATPAALLTLKEECKKPAYATNPVCKLFGSSTTTSGPSAGTGGLLDPLLGGLGLGRAPVAVKSDPIKLSDLMTRYDPALVQLMLPGVAK